MTETAGAGPEGVARLDELAAVTREYAKFSRWAFGFASAALGAWLGVAAIVRVQWLRWSDVLLAFAPLGYVEFLRVARAYYQRRGEVVPHEPRAGLVAGAVALLAAAARAPRCTRGGEDASTVNLLLFVVSTEIGRRSAGISPYAVAGMALFFVAGVWQPLGFLRLEHRFAALRSPPA